jgi:hypothetical protein
MWDLWGLLNLVAFVTTWSNHNHYSMVVVGGGMGCPRTTVGLAHIVKPRFHPECRGAILSSEGLSER